MTSSQILFLSDLDHNLFQSLRVDPQGMHPMTAKKDGKTHCYANDAQKTLLDLMTKNAFCVAVTARNPDQMMRVVGWNTAQQHDVALTDLGLTMLLREDKGEWRAVPEWSDQYLRIARGKMLGLQVDFAQFKDTISARFGDQASTLSLNMTYCHEAPEVPYYFVMQGSSQSPDATEIRSVCEQFLGECQGDYSYHESENTFAFWPTYVSKEMAVQRLMDCFDHGLNDDGFEKARREKGKSKLILSSGDSISDLGFMKAAHFWMAPSISQISSAVERSEILTPADYKD